jgi:16S rRNA (guanine527-N7)-methyltransferase
LSVASAPAPGAAVEGGVSAPPAPASATHLFGPALPVVTRFAHLLASAGIERGLLGPREVDRLWERHLVNCGVVAPELRGPVVVDLGSGAGLPGLVLAAMRPDLTFVLVDATRRRVEFVDEAVAALALGNVTTRWARAESLAGELVADEVVARAVAPLGRLAAWSLPLLRPGGRLLAIKGESADAEAAAEAVAVGRAGGSRPTVRRLGADVVDPPAALIEVVRRVAQRKGGATR